MSKILKSMSCCFLAGNWLIFIFGIGRGFLFKLRLPVGTISGSFESTGCGFCSILRNKLANGLGFGILFGILVF